MSLDIAMVTFDSADPGQAAAWWAAQFGGEVQELMADEFVVVIRPEGPRLGFQKVPDPTPGKNRVHLDFTADDDLDAQVARLVKAGATETERHDFGPAFRWVVLADPEGNAFCVAKHGDAG
jgi:predicted enzyme related to lactoylglutathione lyase